MIATPPRYVPEGLPLRGADWSLQAHHPRTSFQDHSIRKQGDTIEVRFPSNSYQDKTLKVGTDRIEVDARARDAQAVVEKRGDTLSVDRDGTWNDTTIRVSPSEIEVSRPGSNRNVTFRRSDRGLEIDRDGTFNDVLIQADGQRIRVLHPGRASDAEAEFSLNGPIALDPVAWRHLTTLNPEALDLLDRWWERGAQVDDLVRLEQNGVITMLDHLLI